ncbi:MAG: hypothetical protein M3370_01685 [Actinomycetota bacterium]|nr:hypothetical protein [Actinomycetota bacterium]
MTEHPDNENAAEEQPDGQDESQQAGSGPGASDPAVEPDIPMPAEDSELSEGA